MIYKETAWNIIKANAKKALITKMVYHSIVEGRAYSIIAVEEKKITIKRVSGGNDETLSEGEVIKAIDVINAAGGKMKRRTLISPTVAKETAFVLFHPEITWDEDGENIEVL